MSAPRPRVLVVDDEAAQREVLRALLTDLGCEVEVAADGRIALTRLAAQLPDLLLLDMRMPELDGLGTLQAMHAAGIRVPTVVVTAHADLDDAVRAMKLGAADYLRKPVDTASLAALIAAQLRTEPDAAASDQPPLPDGVVIASPLMAEVCRDLAQVARSEAPVLLSGETGTGKEVLADLVHRWSGRSSGPFTAVNVASLPETLVEAELFGARRGAYTGADRDREGRFQEADGGTLFLDEIGELPLALQPKLLRALQEKRVARLGDPHERSVDFRLVSATNRDLEEAIAAGAFREDLYYRLAVVVIEIPPLRERREDILPLADRFLAAAGAGRKRLSPAAERALLAHRWPGNVRELQNTMLRAAILAAGDVVLPENLPPALRRPPDEPEPASALTLAAIERRAILDALERCAGNRSEAARLLGISRRTLLYRLKEYRGEDGAAVPD
jgi:DNA-binding NtrC family response regulator